MTLEKFAILFVKLKVGKKENRVEFHSNITGNRQRLLKRTVKNKWKILGDSKEDSKRTVKIEILIYQGFEEDSKRTVKDSKKFTCKKLGDSKDSKRTVKGQ